MRRPLVTTTCALVLALAPVALFAQEPPPTQPPPAQQPPEQQQPQAKEPRIPLTGDAGVFIYQIKPGQTSTFEELMTKVQEGLGRSEDPVRRQQADGWKLYRSTEALPEGGNALYVLLADPAVKAAEYDPLVLLAESLGADAATPENQEMLKRYADVFAGLNKINLAPLGRAHH